MPIYELSAVFNVDIRIFSVRVSFFSLGLKSTRGYAYFTVTHGFRDYNFYIRNGGCLDHTPNRD